MTLKLVADNGLAVEETGIVAALRDLADRIEADEYPGAFRVVVVIETADALSREILGEQMSGFEIIGMMEVVKANTINDPFGD